jgi:hypothetical protein
LAAQHPGLSSAAANTAMHPLPESQVIELRQYTLQPGQRDDHFV